MLNWTMDLKVIALVLNLHLAIHFNASFTFFFFACPEKFDILLGTVSIVTDQLSCVRLDPCNAKD